MPHFAVGPLGRQSHFLKILMQGRGGEGQDLNIHQSGHDVNEDAPSHTPIPVRSQVEVETQVHGQENINQGV
jgi:hypothetical protein